jgi:polar amino acid transport system substrate-binding protein
MISLSTPRRFTAVALLGAVAAALALSGCESTSAAPPVSSNCTPKDKGLTTYTSGTLTVGVPENPPYTKTEGTSASGLEIDIVTKLAADECLNIAYVPITYANGIPMISEQKRTDIATGGWYVTAARAKQVGFTTPTFYDTMGIISKTGASSVSDIQSVGTVGTGTGFSWNEDMTKILGASLKQYPGTVEMKQDLLNGRLQAALDGYAVAVDAYKGTDFKVEPAKKDDRVAITTSQPTIAFPVAKENTALSNALSGLIDSYRKDGSLAAILAKYSLPSDLLVPADKAAASIR